MADETVRLAAALEAVASAQERLLACLLEQRPALVAGRHGDVEAAVARADVEVRRLAVAERGRVAAAQALADARGLPGARWALLAAGVDAEERALLAPLVDRVEHLVRDLELANAVNGQIVRQELEVMDASMRGLAGAGPRSYTAAGARADAPPPRPMMLNTAA